MSEKPENIKIIHKPANDFRGYYVTGVVVSGPTSDDLFHLTFHIDAIISMRSISSRKRGPCSKKGTRAPKAIEVLTS